MNSKKSHRTSVTEISFKTKFLIKFYCCCTNFYKKLTIIVRLVSFSHNSFYFTEKSNSSHLSKKFHASDEKFMAKFFRGCPRLPESAFIFLSETS